MFATLTFTAVPMTTTEPSPAAAADLVTVQTQMRGPMQFPRDRILRFVSPLLGFENLDHFVIFQTQPGPLSWMQATEDPKVCFCILAPFRAGLNLDLEITPEDAVDIGANRAEDIEVYTIVVLDRDVNNIRTNFRAPLLVCPRTGLAKQLVLNNNALPIQFRLSDLLTPPKG